MAFLELLLDAVHSSPVTTALAVIWCIFTANGIYNLFLHPIAHLEGPLLPKVTSLWLYYHAYIGDEASTIRALHAKYGPLVRVAPNQVDIGDADAIQALYVTGGGFPKSPCYANFDIDSHATIFSTIDMEYRNPRAKAVVSLFSTASIRSNSDLLYESVDQMVIRMQQGAATGLPINLLNLTRSMAVDIVSTHLFQVNYNGSSEKTERLSVSKFVDAFVAVGRFFYVPNWAFGWLEWGIDKLADNEQTYSSMEVVEKFVDNLVGRLEKGDSSYPGRLMDLGLQISEIKSQCKDLIFAGTDSTGMNLATICRYLALHQDKYSSSPSLDGLNRLTKTRLERLRKELEDNKSTGVLADIQSLPYLSAVIREVLRISMANPTRLVRRVPPGGWTFKSTFFPSGTDVGCAAHELHLDPQVFDDPETFNPERWLTENVNAKERMNKNWFAFGAGVRGCIARNLAMTELYMATERIVESGVLEGAVACQDKVEIYEWFNSSVKGEKIELVWPTKISV